MKNKFTISLCVIALLASVFLWWPHNGEKPKLAVSPQIPSANAPDADNTVPSIVRTQQADTNIGAASTPEGQVASATVDSVAVNEKIRAEVESKNIPFDFYGQAIDQESNALSEVSFDIWARHWDPDSTAPIHLTRKTDSNGRFDIHGITGDAFDIRSVGKEGYELEPGQLGFGAVGGSFQKPVIFKMWSTNIHEQLITGGNKLQIVPDGRPYFIDLTKGTISETAGGELKVWIQYTNQAVRGQLYDWSCEIDVISGVLLEEPLGTAMYEAPTDGYVPSFQFRGQLKGGQRGDIGERHFYLKLKNGQEYGRITIELFAPFNDQTPGLIRLSYAINPSGSRILR